MGLFSKIKKAFKKITSKVKKVVKKVVKGVKKVVKKIGSSKILKAIAIAGAAIVTGGAALGAFGSGAGLSATKFGTWMMGTSQKALAGNLFGGSGVLSKIGNFAVQTASKPFGAVGGALGSTARVGANILTGQSAFAAGPAVGAPVPFSGAALSGQMNTENIYYDEQSNMFMDNSSGSPVPLTRDEVARLPESFTKLDDFGIPQGANTLNEAGEVVKATADAAQSTGLREFGRTVGTRVATNVFTGAAMSAIQGDPELRGTTLPGGGQERAGAFDPLRIYASENNINVSDIYNQVLYGNADPSSMYGSQLYSQETIEVA
jgi:hypothetical protein